MALSTTIVTFLNNKGGVFDAPVDADPVAALAAAIRKDVRAVRTAIQDLSAKDRIWVRRTAKGDKPPAIGLHAKAHAQGDRTPVCRG